MTDEVYFGWEPFVAASSEAKGKYILAQVFEGLREIVEDRELRAILSASLCGMDLKDVYRLIAGGGNLIDHQSVWPIPQTGDSLAVWIREMKDFLLRPDVAIIGGNDNEPIEPDRIVPGCRVCRLNIPSGYRRLVFRHDPKFGFWVAFDKESGNRIRFRWSEDPVPERGSIPELVDVKITTRCMRGCPFCYQGSEMDGEDAPSIYISRLLYSLRDLNVFEVVFGGGEPTLHPDFVSILEDASDLGLSVSFTTRDIDWLEDHADCIRPLVRAIGVSCSTRWDVVSMFERAALHNLLDKMVIHIIPDLESKDNKPLEALEACFLLGLRPLLLGLKTTGRARDLSPRLPDGFMEKLRGHTVSVDAVFASRYKELLQSGGVRSELYDASDYPWGCYIDAVQRTISPNSYTCDKARKLDSVTPEGILAGFDETSRGD